MQEAHNFNKMSINKNYFENDLQIVFKQVLHPELQNYFRKEKEFLREFVKGGSVLDVGIGNGDSLLPVLGNVQSSHGIDRSGIMLEECIKKLSGHSNVRLYKAMADKLPFAESVFDYVICMGATFGNWHDNSGEMREMLRVAKGPVIVSVYSPLARDMQVAAYKAIGHIITHETDDKVFTDQNFVSKRFTKQELKEIAVRHDAGIEIFSPSPMNYVAVFRK